MIAFHALEESRLLQLARQLGPLCEAGDMLCLSGALGAGKTTFARGLIQGLGWPITAEVASPTYNLVTLYAPPEVRLPVAHVDLYRLDEAQQVAGLGLDDMMDDHLMIIEWPERWGALLPQNHLRIAISGHIDVREIEMHGPADWMNRLAPLKTMP